MVEFPRNVISNSQETLSRGAVVRDLPDTIALFAVPLMAVDAVASAVSLSGLTAGLFCLRATRKALFRAALLLPFGTIGWWSTLFVLLNCCKIEILCSGNN